ncbi:hypothetical protein [Niallia endozanthoxylica]|uniref:Uncharacterized protein n=1 Tax=Niallia endozanthoxylica TaxID=2036016 RepID=A0A5J5HEF6_9BACI|nr:hypothetical protein [Niallia endozanthoxylica]KAA9018053.1 hypothetical protein F4V44_20760 [Niallia endozanthoxylica]
MYTVLPKMKADSVFYRQNPLCKMGQPSNKGSPFVIKLGNFEFHYFAYTDKKPPRNSRWQQRKIILIYKISIKSRSINHY